MRHFHVQGFVYSVDLQKALSEGSNVANSRGVEEVSTLEEWAVPAPSFEEWHHSSLDVVITIVLVGGWSARKVWSLSMRKDLSGLGSIKGNFISKPD